MSAFGGIAEATTLSPLLPLLAYGDAFASGQLATRESADALQHRFAFSDALEQADGSLAPYCEPERFQQCHSGA
jgi:hypothetical protein